MSITSNADFPLDANVIDGIELCARLNRWRADQNTMNLNSTRPPYITTGGVWVRDNGAAATPRYELMLFDGTKDVKAGGSSFDAGTKITFNQTAAPTGWTKLTTHDNAALRVVSGAVGDGGSVAFTTAFSSKTPAGSVSTSVSGTVASHTLVISEIPAHNHSVIRAPGGTVGEMTGSSGFCASGFTRSNADVQGWPWVTDHNGSNGGHAHGWSGTANSTFTGTAIDLAVKYVDVIICSKD